MPAPEIKTKNFNPTQADLLSFEHNKKMKGIIERLNSLEKWKIDIDSRLRTLENRQPNKQK